jgi:hypothetical protein
MNDYLAHKIGTLALGLLAAICFTVALYWAGHGHWLGCILASWTGLLWTRGMLQ